MAIGITRPVAGLASTANTTSYAMTAFTPSANSLLVVFVYATGTVVATPTMSGGSLTWTREFISIWTSEFVVYWAKVGGLPVSTTITFDCTGDAATSCDMSVVQFTGYNSTISNPIRQTIIEQSATAANAIYTYSSALNTNNGYALAVITGSFTSANQFAPPSGWTEADDLYIGTPNTSLATAYLAGGQTTTGPFVFTNLSCLYSIFGVEVYESSQPIISTGLLPFCISPQGTR